MLSTMKNPAKRSTRARNVYVLSAFITLPTLAMAIMVDLTVITMNSPDFCGKTFVVDYEEKEYHVVMNKDRSKGSSLEGCKLLFKSKRPGGRVCLVIVGDYAKVDDFRSRLVIYNGEGYRHQLLLIARYNYKAREVCSTFPILQMNWMRKTKWVRPDPFALSGTFNVVDIRSRRRQLAIEEYFCGYHFLDASWVDVVNRFGYSFKMRDPGHQKCGLMFMPPVDSSRRICGLFVPNEDIQSLCNKTGQPQWHLFASRDMRNFMKKENDLIRVKCQYANPLLTKTLSFCAPPNQKVTVFMNRSEPMIDPPFVFRLLIADRGAQEWKTFRDDALKIVLKEIGPLPSPIPKESLEGKVQELQASTSSAVAVTATFSVVSVETILLCSLLTC